MLFIRDAQRNEERGVGVSVEKAKVKGTRAVIAVPAHLRNIKLSSFFISFTVEMLSYSQAAILFGCCFGPQIYCSSCVFTGKH